MPPTVRAAAGDERHKERVILDANRHSLINKSLLLLKISVQ